MADKLYMVHLKGSDDPSDKAYQQPVRASKVESSEGAVIFTNADGTLSAFFDASIVDSWNEIDESTTGMRDETTPNWVEYYRLRTLARLSLLSIPIGLYLLLSVPEALKSRLNDLRFPAQITVIFGIIGIMAIVFSVPVLKWAEWRCPRCGEKFVQPKAQFGYYPLGPVFGRLVFNSHCATCNLRTGAPITEPTTPERSRSR